MLGGLLLFFSTFVNRQIQDGYIDFDESCIGPSCTSHQEDTPCQSFTDCFNCSLAMCAWSETNTCTEDPNRGWGSGRGSWQRVSSWYDFELEKKVQCGDPLGLCDRQSQGNLTTFGWKSDKPNTKIPSGYFCTETFPNPKKDQHFFWINHTQIAGKNNQIVLQDRHETNGILGDTR